jgi:glycosyltransferase involved in cell wall biosynthesis
MDNKNFLISVLTPTWNRASYLNTVWESLVNQSYLNFEWIVANDGSTDDTVQVVSNLATKSNFPVTLINASCRIGKSRMDNEAVRTAKGDFIIWCDSDDYLMPNALEALINSWNSIPSTERGDFCGVTALCDTENKILGRSYPLNNYTDIVFNDLFNMIQTDLVIFTRSDYLKSVPFVEVDYLIPETSVWNEIGVRKTRFIPKILERKNYGVENSLSFTGLMEYNRGRAYALAITKKFIWKDLSIKDRILRMINYIRYCFHGEIITVDALQLWNANIPVKLIFFLLFPFAILFVLNDIRRGKVRKTHRQFYEANKVVNIDYKILKS